MKGIEIVLLVQEVRRFFNVGVLHIGAASVVEVLQSTGLPPLVINMLLGWRTHRERSCSAVAVQAFNKAGHRNCYLQTNSSFRRSNSKCLKVP